MNQFDPLLFEKNARNAALEWKSNHKTDLLTLEGILKLRVSEGYLLCGSYYDISSGSLLIKKDHKTRKTRIVATPSTFIALVHALVNPYLSHVDYGGYYGHHKPNPKVKFKSWTVDPIVAQGFVFVVPADGFINNPKNGSWKYTHDGPVKFLDKIPVTLADFDYAIIDMTCGGFKKVHEPKNTYHLVASPTVTYSKRL